MRIMPERTLRNWKDGAGTGSGRTQANAQFIQICSIITTDTVQGNTVGFPVLMCCYGRQRRNLGRGGNRHEYIAEDIEKQDIYQQRVKSEVKTK